MIGEGLPMGVSDERNVFEAMPPVRRHLRDISIRRPVLRTSPIAAERMVVIAQASWMPSPVRTADILNWYQKRSKQAKEGDEGGGTHESAGTRGQDEFPTAPQ